jgi:hypothetical protein
MVCCRLSMVARRALTEPVFPTRSHHLAYLGLKEDSDASPKACAAVLLSMSASIATADPIHFIPSRPLA